MLTREEVEKIAKLAKLSFDEEQIQTFTHQLGNILNFVEQLQEVDTEGVEETSQVTGLTNVQQADEVQACPYMEALLACTPHTVEQQSIKIPKIM